MKRAIDWLLLQTGGLWGLCCLLKRHSWRRYGAFEHEEDEDAHDESEVTGRVYVKRECLWCEVPGPTVAATEEEAERYREAQWEPMQPVERVVPATAPVPPRKPFTAAKMFAPNSDRLLRTQDLLAHKSGAEVTVEIMAAQCVHHLPMHATDRDLATGAVVGLGPMKPAPDTNES